MHIILLGPPGAGKGTQALLICETFGLARLSTGDLLRREVAAQSAVGRAVADCMASGQLVPHAIVTALIQGQVQHLGAKRGFVLDGFPRMVEQAEALEIAEIAINHVICIDVPDAQIIQRLSGRRIHLSSGRTYHMSLHPSLQDDVTGEELVHREDDQVEVVAKRLAIYHQTTEPLIAWYKQKNLRLSRVSGVGSIGIVWERIRKVFATKDF